jgi:hypothetical protein
MPLLTELEIFLGWISTNMSPLTGLFFFGSLHRLAHRQPV